MGLLRLPRRAPRDEPPPPERLEVTDYRAFLLSAPHERLVSAHRAALAGLDPFLRAVIRNLAAERTGAGSEVRPEDTAALSDLLVAGDADRRAAILDAYDDGVRHRLAHAVAVVLEPPEASTVEEQLRDERSSTEASLDEQAPDGTSPDEQSAHQPGPVIHAAEAQPAVSVLR